jgi:NADPH:quinone reductase-like Zn-dependent oxidoreductase
VRRVLIRAPGGYEALQIVEEPDRAPAVGEVAIDVGAIGVNYADTIVRMGLYASARELHGYPITPGFEVAGRVAAVGAGVAAFAPGDAVLALTLFGGYSSRVCLPADRVFALPSGIDATRAAALPAVFLTAWFMVHQLVHPRAGDRWLVHSAAGGVGGALAQLGRLAGCRVTGVVGSAHKIDAARTAGCHDVIDKSRERLWPRAEQLAADGFDAVFDANGVSTLAGSYAHLAPAGKLVVYGFASMLPRVGGRPNWLKLAWDWLRTPRFSPLAMTQRNRSVLACNLSYLSGRADVLVEGMRWILEHVERGELTPPPVTTFPLERVADAHRAIESGTTAGKLILIP